ncbi:MAG: CBS domain-containing protein [Thermoplasmata archaeon]
MAATWPTARDLMTARPITIPNDAPLSQALGIMERRKVHELPVMRKQKLIGMITMESIARRTNLALTTKVEHLMMLPPLITEATPYPELAERLLAAGLRAAPVVGRRSELVGVISRTDLIRALPGVHGIGEHRVEEIQTAPGLVVSEGDRLDSLLSQLRLLEEHPLAVIDSKGRLVGAVGVADLTRVFWRPVDGGKGDAVRHDPRTRHAFEVDVGSIMHAPAVTVPLGTSATAAARLMTKEKVSSVFVVEDGRPVGVVSQGDLLGLAVGASPKAGGIRGSSSDVYVQIHGLRGSGDPQTLLEIDRVIAQGLRRISHHVRPQLLSLNISPHATHRSGDATVQARLHTDRGIFYATDTEWNYLVGIAVLMDELAEQVRRMHEESRSQRRRAPTRGEMEVDETVGTPDLEAKLLEVATPPRRRR